MGVFLQTAILPGAAECDARKAVERAARLQGCELTEKLCRYTGNRLGVQIFFGDETSGFFELAENLSKALKGPVLLAYIYDGDFWGYNLYDDGCEIDRYEGMPDCFSEVTEKQPLRATGTPESLARYFSVEADSIRNYLVPWTEELLEAGKKAYPEDQYPYGDCWQLTDFLTKLGWPTERAEPAAPPPLPTLAEILSKNLPPFPMENPRITAWDADTYYHTGTLPTVLDREYIRRLLAEQEGLQYLADKTPQEIIEVRQTAQAAIKYPSRQHIHPQLAILSAFCKYWLGDAVGTFWDLYEAVYNDPDNIYLLRGRSLAVALFTKRHIAIKDLTRLMELDPENRDVYLLCRAFFYSLDERKTSLAAADMTELKRLGIPGQDNPRLFWSGFPKRFLLGLKA